MTLDKALLLTLATLLLCSCASRAPAPDSSEDLSEQIIKGIEEAQAAEQPSATQTGRAEMASSIAIDAYTGKEAGTQLPTLPQEWSCKFKVRATSAIRKRRSFNVLLTKKPDLMSIRLSGPLGINEVYIVQTRRNILVRTAKGVWPLGAIPENIQKNLDLLVNYIQPDSRMTKETPLGALPDLPKLARWVLARPAPTGVMQQARYNAENQLAFLQQDDWSLRYTNHRGKYLLPRNIQILSPSGKLSLTMRNRSCKFGA